MKQIRIQFLLVLIIGSFTTCSNEDEPKISGVNDISGNFRLFIPNDAYMCAQSLGNIDISGEDLVITKNGRFKQKIYYYNSANICVSDEIYEGQITITGSFYNLPFGTLKYDNSSKSYNIHFSVSENGKHNEVYIEITSASYSYVRAN